MRNAFKTTQHAIERMLESAGMSKNQIESYLPTFKPQRLIKRIENNPIIRDGENLYVRLDDLGVFGLIEENGVYVLKTFIGKDRMNEGKAYRAFKNAA